MGAKVEIPVAIGEELIARFGRRLRIVSEKDFRKMRRALLDELDWKESEFKSETVVIIGGSKKKCSR